VLRQRQDFEAGIGQGFLDIYGQGG
jgi:hypothetical protein